MIVVLCERVLFKQNNGIEMTEEQSRADFKYPSENGTTYGRPRVWTCSAPSWRFTWFDNPTPPDEDVVAHRPIKQQKVHKRNGPGRPRKRTQGSEEELDEGEAASDE